MQQNKKQQPSTAITRDPQQANVGIHRQAYPHRPPSQHQRHPGAHHQQQPRGFARGGMLLLLFHCSHYLTAAHNRAPHFVDGQQQQQRFRHQTAHNVQHNLTLDGHRMQQQQQQHGGERMMMMMAHERMAIGGRREFPKCASDCLNGMCCMFGGHFAGDGELNQNNIRFHSAAIDSFCAGVTTDKVASDRIQEMIDVDLFSTQTIYTDIELKDDIDLSRLSTVQQTELNVMLMTYFKVCCLETLVRTPFVDKSNNIINTF
jgi:hypothetical protein